MPNRITAFKGRSIDLSKPVRVYRNLNSKGVSYSIKQGSHVVAHTDCLTLQNIRFIVSQKGKARVHSQKQRNVHAFIEGFVVSRVMEYSASELERMSKIWFNRISYNPYSDKGFYLTVKDKVKELQIAYAAFITNKGVYVGGWHSPTSR